MRDGGRFAIFCALGTPFGVDGEVDLGVLGRHVEWLVGEGVDGLMPCGSAGEGPLLEDAEIIAVVRRTVEAAAGQVTVMAHVGRPSTRATAGLAVEAAEAGADALSAVTPWYYRLEDEQLFEHYGAVQEAVPERDLYAYSIPHLAGNEVSVELAGALAEAGLSGLKESSGSRERLGEYLSVAGRSRRDEGFAVLAGSEPLVLDSLREGAAGCVLGLVNLRPDLLVGLRAAFGGGREEEAAGLQEEISWRSAELDRGPSFTGLARAVAERLAPLGIDYPARQRLPLGPAPARAQAAEGRRCGAVAPPR